MQRVGASRRARSAASTALDEILTEEILLRENRRVKIALLVARLTTIKTLAGLDLTFQPSLDRERLMALAELTFIDWAEVVHLLGPPGTGKSHLATALAVEAVNAGRSVVVPTLSGLIASLAKAERDGALRDRICYLSRASLLVVDKIGYLPVVPGGSRFFQLVNARYKKGVMTLSLNRGFAEWGEVFGDPAEAAALLDRLLHRAIVVQVEGASYRLRQHGDLIPEHIRSRKLHTPPPGPARGKATLDHING